MKIQVQVQSTVIDPGTVQAYRETEYVVHAHAPVTLNVGVASPGLLAMYKTRRVDSCTFITACNPGSRRLPDVDNALRQGALARELRLRSLLFIEGVGQHPSNRWPPEPSFLVLDLSLEAAKALGSRHEQNAIVWCGADATPLLVLLR